MNKNKAFKVEIRIIYADTDQMGIVYHANYLKYFEIARTELIRNLGMSYKDFEKYGVYMPVKETFIDFKSPVNYDDIIIVYAEIEKLKHVSIKISYEIYGLENNILHTKGYTLHPFTNKEGRISRPSSELYNIIANGKQHEVDTNTI